MNDSERKQRTVRSFVRRTGRLTASQSRAIEEEWPHYGIDYAAMPLNLVTVFGRDADCVLEIGFGNGESLLSEAADHPECNFIGVEVHEPGIGHCLIGAREAGLRNLRIIRHDAVEVLRYQLASGALARVNLFFPDPWPKKRHHKRRIVQPDFLALVADRLQPGGRLRIATDWDNYAEHIDETIAAAPDFELEWRREHQGDDPGLGRETTKFERRGLRQGHRIHDWQLVRR